MFSVLKKAVLLFILFSPVFLFSIEEEPVIDDDLYSPLREQKSLLDIERDFTAPFTNEESLGKWLFALDINGGFEGEIATSGFQMLSGYRDKNYGAIFSLRLQAMEVDSEDKHGNLKLEKFALKNVSGGGAYDYADHWSDIFWNIQKAYYKRKINEADFSINVEELPDFSSTTGTAFLGYSGITGHSLQNRRPLKVAYTGKRSNFYYLNDDAADLDFHLIAMNGRPIANGFFSDWNLSAVFFVDMDLQDYGSYRFEDYTHSDYTLSSASLASSLPVYKAVSYSVFFDTEIFTLKTMSEGGGYVATGGLSYKRKSYSIGIDALSFQGQLYPEPFLSPFFDTNRQLLIQNKPDFGFSKGLQFRFGLFTGQKTKANLLVRYFGKNPGMYFGFVISSGIHFDDSLFWSISYFRREIKKSRNFTDMFAANSVTKFSLSYFISSRLEVAINIFLEPLPLLSNSLLSATATDNSAKGEMFTRYFF